MTSFNPKHLRSIRVMNKPGQIQGHSKEYKLRDRFYLITVSHHQAKNQPQTSHDQHRVGAIETIH